MSANTALCLSRSRGMEQARSEIDYRAGPHRARQPAAEGGGTPQHQMIAASIKARIDEELDIVDGRSRGFFQSSDIGPVKGCKPPAEVVATQHGFFGPFCE
eukprot:COSAG01_NODE_4754_length_4764_cov_12.145123_1_plen_101_part_00